MAIEYYKSMDYFVLFDIERLCDIARYPDTDLLLSCAYMTGTIDFQINCDCSDALK